MAIKRNIRNTNRFIQSTKKLQNNSKDMLISSKKGSHTEKIPLPNEVDNIPKARPKTQNNSSNTFLNNIFNNINIETDHIILIGLLFILFDGGLVDELLIIALLYILL